ncbi:MAG: purine-nucleoside phosphorylase [Oscillospiraceae bacterium]|jgi:purine-nucleoside phosphorylase|nr:purine-nucleoside phosphorylase [Oscillospiraceae bacterium]
MLTQYKTSADYIRQRAGGFAPEIVLVLGSGLGFLGDRCENAVVIPYGDIPHFPRSTAPGHAGKLVLGELSGRRAAVMQGRFHYYEGYSYIESVYGIRTLRLLGAKTLLVTNASGGIGYAPGDIMMITDHIKFFDESPLRGENIPEFGTRFPDMSFAYTPELRRKARAAAETLGVPLREGVYMYFPGPQYETPAEIRAAKILGADAVGMSTVPEVIAAAHAGMDTLGFSLVCNMAAGLQSHGLSEQEVLDTAERSKETFSQLILRCLEEL